MKAIVYTEYGSPDVLSLEDVEIPTPKDNELLIKIVATTVNRTDCAQLRAKPFIMRFFTGLLKPKRPILGTAFAGDVSAVGKSVSNFQVGDRIFGFNDDGLSSHAEFMTIPSDKALEKIPENITYEEAAACSEGAHYAINFIKKIKIDENSKILVNGATGAIGSASLQLFKHYGAEVAAVCGTAHLELITSLGADRVIDYKNTDFTQDKQTYDFICDAVGKSTFSKCKSLLNPKGIYVSSEPGAIAQNIFYALLTPLFGGKIVKFPIPTDIHNSLLLIKKLMEQDEYKPLIDKSYPLENIAEAYRYVETGEKIGNVVILVK